MVWFTSAIVSKMYPTFYNGNKLLLEILLKLLERGLVFFMYELAKVTSFCLIERMSRI